MSVIDDSSTGGDRGIADAVRALSARPHDAAVKHPGQAHVLNESISAADLLGDVGPRHARADDAIRVARLRDRVVGVLARKLDAAVVGDLLELSIERFARDEVGIGDGALEHRRATDTTPFATVRSSTGASSRSDASSSSTRRASAAAARVSVPPIAAVRLAAVKPFVDTNVSTVTVLT